MAKYLIKGGVKGLESFYRDKRHHGKLEDDAFLTLAHMIAPSWVDDSSAREIKEHCSWLEKTQKKIPAVNGTITNFTDICYLKKGLWDCRVEFDQEGAMFVQGLRQNRLKKHELEARIRQKVRIETQFKITRLSMNDAKGDETGILFLLGNAVSEELPDCDELDKCLEEDRSQVEIDRLKELINQAVANNSEGGWFFILDSSCCNNKIINILSTRLPHIYFFLLGGTNMELEIPESVHCLPRLCPENEKTQYDDFCNLQFKMTRIKGSNHDNLRKI